MKHKNYYQSLALVCIAGQSSAMDNSLTNFLSRMGGMGMNLEDGDISDSFDVM